MVPGGMLTEAEQASEKVEEDAGMLVRRKRGIAGGKENGSHQPEPAITGEEQRSVYVNGDQGILSTGGTSGMQIREENPFIDDKDNIQVNGKKDSRIKEYRKLDNSLVSEEQSNHRSTDVILENGSTSNLTKGCNEFGVVRSEFEVEEDTHVELEKKSKLEVTEIDLEKVLEEQETHDLYCPNCNSCITKRVILRKRRRTVRETQCDTPTAKVRQLQHLDSTAASADEMTELSHDREPDIFRCLSCFSFFIPTDAGFNIFRIFGRRAETENQVTSQLLPAKTGNIGRPVLKPVGSSSRASESDLPVSTASTIDSVQHMDELSTNIQTDPAANALGAISFGESQITTKKNGADTSFNIFRIFGRRRETEIRRTSQQLPAKNVTWNSSIFNSSASTSTTSQSGLPLLSGSTVTSVQQNGETSMNIQASSGTTFRAVSVGKSQITTEKNDPGVQFGVETNNIFGEDPSFKEKQRPLTNVVSDAMKLEKGQSTIEEMDADANIWEHFINDEKQVGNPAKGIVQRYPDKIESEDPNLGKGQTITDVESWINDGKLLGDLAKGIVGNPAKGIIQRYLDKIESEDPNLGKGRTITGMESWINDGKQVGDLAKVIVGNPAKGIIQRYRDKIESEDPNLGKGRTITDMESWINGGKQVGDLAKGSVQRYLNKTESEDPNLGKSQPIITIGDTGDDTVGPVDIIMPTFPAMTSHSQFSQNINVSVVSTHETQIYVGEPTEGEAGRRRDWDVLKSIVYGGLIESVTSLSIVSSAAGGNASTLNIVALALAYLIGGLFLIAHNISELRVAQEETTNQNGELVGRYWELLGRKANSRLHATVAVLSYLLMGLLPPVIYGFSFRKSDDKEYKLTAVAASSLVCISLLAIGKAHVSAQRAYIKSMAYYLSLGYAASGLSYVAGVMIHRLLDQLGLFDNSAAAPVPPSDVYPYVGSTLEAWASS